jgi:hypothetical protein
MGSGRERNSRTWGGPQSDEAEAQIWAGYRTALASLTIPQLMDRLAEINRQQQALSLSMGLPQASSLSTFTEALDRPVLSSMGMATPVGSPSMDRGSAPSPSPQQSPLDQLAASRRLGPRLAERLALAGARAEARRSRSG